MPSEGAPMPEVQLAAAVIRRALEDALTPDGRLANGSATGSMEGRQQAASSGTTSRERDEAVRFLLDTAPGWAGSREAWCDVAGIDVEVVRRHALKVIPHYSIPADLHRMLRLPTPVVPTARCIAEAA